MTHAYCRRFDISRIGLRMEPGVVAAAAPVCNLDIRFGPGSRVQFKLQGALAMIGERVETLCADGSVDSPVAVDAVALEAELETLFKSIEGRLARIQHEQEVQGIVFLGNTFVLNNRTVFEVVEDVDGRLGIEMHKGPQRQRAMLLASSLLDGLYDGSIVLRK